MRDKVVKRTRCRTSRRARACAIPWRMLRGPRWVSLQASMLSTKRAALTIGELAPRPVTASIARHSAGFEESRRLAAPMVSLTAFQARPVGHTDRPDDRSRCKAHTYLQGNSDRSAPRISRVGIRLEVSRGPLAVRATWQIWAVTECAARVRKLLMADAGQTR